MLYPLMAIVDCHFSSRLHGLLLKAPLSSLVKCQIQLML
jgi:hypothetical protein